MTREGAINKLNWALDNNTIEDVQSAYDYIIALKMAIKALEQEPILEKIRAEMFEEMLSHSGTGEEVIQAYADGLKKGLDILDKYKGK